MLPPWQEMAHEKGLQWEVNLEAHLPLLYGDALRLGQVMGNLISNAIKMTPAGGKISLAAGQETDQIWLRVSDTGPGIQPEELQKIFEPFYRGQSGTRLDTGMGLGLSIAKNLVEAHGGVLQVDSRPGAGSAFTVWLPLNAAA
jgi:signal transduction histidine kinase